MNKTANHVEKTIDRLTPEEERLLDQECSTFESVLQSDEAIDNTVDHIISVSSAEILQLQHVVEVLKEKRSAVTVAEANGLRVTSATASGHLVDLTADLINLGLMLLMRRARNALPSIPEKKE